MVNDSSVISYLLVLKNPCGMLVLASNKKMQQSNKSKDDKRKIRDLPTLVEKTAPLRVCPLTVRLPNSESVY
jgi:hypothetical protein